MTRRSSFAITFMSLSLVAYACSEAEDGAPVIPANAGADATSEAAPTGDGAAQEASIPVGDAAAARGVILNELSPGDEWIELVNSGKQPVDLSGFYVADRDKDGGAPKVDEAAKIPPGTILSPNAYLLVRGGGLDAGKTCPDGGQSYCLNAEFGIGNKTGETIFLLDPNQKELERVVYPPEAAPKGASFGRIPSGDPMGVFQITVETPGAPNRVN